MTMKLPCAVVRDLLPLYAEKMTEPETRSLVDAHLEDCVECRQRLAEIDTGVASLPESTKPLLAIKKEIRKRRLMSAFAAALLAFIIVYAWFYHDGKSVLIPWQAGLIEVEGIQSRPYGEVYGSVEPLDAPKAKVDVLVLNVDGIVNGTKESTFISEDRSRTVVLQGWRSNHSGGSLVKDRNELLLYPVPDRVLYGSGSGQQLLWGEPLDGGVEVLPRLALAYYVIAAAGSALILGAAWLILRKWKHRWVLRQLFLAPVSYLIAHLLIMGTGTESFFMERDFFSILLIAAALYALFSLAWQLWSRQRRTGC